MKVFLLTFILAATLGGNANASWLWSSGADGLHRVGAGNSGIFPLKGVNQAGMEFSGLVFVPSEASINYFNDNGVDVFRVPIKWERIQPTLSGDLDTTYLNQLKTVVGFATSNGQYTIIDVHNYGKFNSTPMYDAGGPTEAQFADLWTKISNEFKTNNLVMFDLMNEPHSITALEMGTAAQAAITAIRATGSTNWIHVEGGGSYASCSSFISSGWGAVAITLTDPEDRLIFQCHTYFDSDNSGTSATAVLGKAKERLTTVTNFARTNGIRLFLGEFGFADNAGMFAETRDALNLMKSNQDVWVGWTTWAAGPAWGDYMYSLEPTFGPLVEKPQMAVLKEFL